mmetsp:Transcript_3340/g.8418  ORF Transcript_3340/g.8418 Transcript_3340/m.8418 type:complete len:479 (-) Transcript_3340:376-1812(-)
MGSLILGSVAVPDLAYHPRMGASTPSSRCKQVITKRREHTWLLPIKCDADLRFGGSFAHGAARKRRLQRAPVEATPDDDDAAGGVLAILPRAARRDLVQLVHRLEDLLHGIARHAQQPLHAVDVRRRVAFLPQQLVQPQLELLHVNVTLHAQADRRHSLIVLVVVVAVAVPVGVIVLPRSGSSSGGGGRLHAPRAIVGLDAQDAGEVHLAPGCADDLRAGVHLQDVGAHGIRLLLAHQIHLVHHHHIRVSNLLLRLIHRAVGLLCLQLALDVVAVHHCHDGIKADARLKLRIRPQGSCHRAWVGQPRGFDEDVVKLVALAHERLQRLHKVVLHAAAEAAVAQLHPLLHHRLRAATLRLLHQRALDAHLLPKLVHDDGDAEAVLRREDVVDQRGLAGPQVARDQRDRHWRVHPLLTRCLGHCRGRLLLGPLLPACPCRGLLLLLLLPLRERHCHRHTLLVAAAASVRHVFGRHKALRLP